MSAILLSRMAFRRQALGAGIGLSIGTMLALRQPAIRMDARAVPRSASRDAAPATSSSRGTSLDPEIIKQLSGGSVTGFLTGLLISAFSKTLVLVLGISVVLIQVAARYGINIVQQLRVKERIGDSRVLAALEKDPAFKLSFGLFFAMSAFMRFQNV